MRYHELFEHVVNLPSRNQDDRLKYVDQIWGMLNVAYKDIGGFLSAANPIELVETPGLWKLVKRGSNITAVIIYKQSYGRKLIGAASDGTTQGKADLIKLLKEDQTLDRSWAEVSGGMERVYQRMGAKPIPNKHAHELTGKRILHLDDDGIHYTRLIAGHPHVKALYGTPKD